LTRQQLFDFLESKTALETDMYVVAKLMKQDTEILRRLYKEYEQIDSIEPTSNTYIISVPYPHELKDKYVEVVITEGEFQHDPLKKNHEQRLRIYLAA